MRPESLVLIVGETIDGALSAGTRDIGGLARPLALALGGSPHGVLIGHRVDDDAAAWSRTGGMAVTVLEHPQCRFPNPPAMATGLAALMPELSPRAICFPHSMRTCQVAATLAYRLGLPCVTGVEAIEHAGDQIRLRRGVLGGKVYQTMAVGTEPAILTVMPGVFGRADDASPAHPTARVDTRRISLSTPAFKIENIVHDAPTDQSLEQARVVVAGGRGIGGPAGVEPLEAVAGIFKAAAVGGSRGACDLGWIPHSRQVGETGRTVSPALYIACGISGAAQHLAGMRGSQTIVAINTDPRAAILGVAHLAVIENAATFLPLLKERYDERRNDAFKEGEKNHAD